MPAARTPRPLDAVFARAQMLDRRGQREEARRAYLDVLSQDMRYPGALTSLGALLSAQGYRGAARTAYQQAIDCHPRDPAGYVNLANLLRTDGAPDAARAHYEAALRLDPALAEAHQGMSYIMMEQGDAAAAEKHRRLGFATRSLTTTPYRGAGRGVTVLQLVSSLGGNIPTRHLLPDQVFQTHSLVADYADQATALPAHDVVLNAIGDADLCRAGLAAAEALLASSRARVINRPRNVLATGRQDIATRFARVPGVVAPRMASLSRAALQGRDVLATLAGHGLGFPLLLRAPGFHTGQHFVKLDGPEALPAALAALPGDPLMAIAYLDASGPDGLARKYRVMMIGGRLYPLHLAISKSWKVHYYTADMADLAEYRAEEAAFLTDMPGVLGATAMTALRTIADRLALDYAGIDFALAPDGRLLLFEANATMVVSSPTAEPWWDYRRSAVAQVLDAVQALLLGGDEERRGPSPTAILPAGS
ncbi:MAG: tetratricopeptide repeat protein [Acetobacteraceae bacterium]